MVQTDLPGLKRHYNADYIFWSFGINELMLVCFECSENTKEEQERESIDKIKNGLHIQFLLEAQQFHVLQRSKL